jgi:hypothetical protein
VGASRNSLRKLASAVMATGIVPDVVRFGGIAPGPSGAGARSRRFGLLF